MVAINILKGISRLSRYCYSIYYQLFNDTRTWNRYVISKWLSSSYNCITQTSNVASTWNRSNDMQLLITRSNQIPNKMFFSWLLINVITVSQPYFIVVWNYISFIVFTWMRPGWFITFISSNRCTRAWCIYKSWLSNILECERLRNNCWSIY